MRTLAACLLVAATSGPGLAQSPFADSAGVWLSVHEVSFGPGASGLSIRADVALGRRFGNGLDLGVRLGRGHRDVRARVPSRFHVGPTAALTVPLAAGVRGRVSGSALLAGYVGGVYQTEVIDGEPTVTVGALAPYQTLTTNVTAAVSRPVRLAGTVRVHPSVGAFAEARRVLGDPGERGAEPTAGAGLHLGLAVSFRAFGQTVALDPYVQVPYRGSASLVGAHGGGGLRLNF